MDRKELKNRINDSFLELAPDIFDQIMDAPLPQTVEACVVEEKPQGLGSIFFSKRNFRMVPVYICMIILCCIGYFGVQWNQKDRVYVTMDVNPSVQMEMSSAYEVKSIKGLNMDGVELVSELDWEKNTSIEEVAADIIAVMCDEDILKDEEMVLITVGGNRKVTCEVVRDKLQNKLQGTLQEKGMRDVALAFQLVENNDNKSGSDRLKKELQDKYGLPADECENMTVKELIECYNAYSSDTIDVQKIMEEENTEKNNIDNEVQKIESITESLTTEAVTEETTEQVKTTDNTESQNSFKENTNDNSTKEKSNKANKNSTKEKKNNANENSTKEKSNNANENSTKEKTTQSPNSNSTKEKGNGNSVAKKEKNTEIAVESEDE